MDIRVDLMMYSLNYIEELDEMMLSMVCWWLSARLVIKTNVIKTYADMK